MKTKKRRVEYISFYNHTGLEEHFTKMAKKGWLIESISNFYWTYRKIEPKDLHFCVTYYPRASDFDPGPSEEQQTFHDFCAHTGWQLTCTWHQMQVFYNEKEKRTYRSTPERCRNCPCKAKCGANEKGQKVHTTHIWQEYLDIVEQLRKTERGKKIYAQRKETIERVFADAKEKHAMRYTHHRGLAAVTRWVKLKYVAMNLKKLANWSWNNSCFAHIFTILPLWHNKTPAFNERKRGFFDRL